MTATGPGSGDDTYDLIDDALYQLAERRHKWLGDPIAAITLLASLIDQAERMIPEHALLARRRHQVALRLRLTQPKTTQRKQPPRPGGQISPVGRGSIFKRC